MTVFEEEKVRELQAEIVELKAEVVALRAELEASKDASDYWNMRFSEEHEKNKRLKYYLTLYRDEPPGQ